LGATCGACGNDLPTGSRFCNKCGTPATGGPAGHARFTSPESYTPQHLAEKILTSKSALEGERKQVTVLFADLKGSMELLADRDPEEARKILDPVLELMMEAVHRYEGTVNQVMGDGIMALFGAPVAHEDHAVRACYGALRMQDAVRRHSEDLRRSHGLEVQIRVGLNSGEVIVRSIGSDLRMDYSAVGQTTHVAARMEQLAAPGSTRLTAETLGLAEGFVDVNALGPVPVRGLAGPVEVYELVGAGAARTRLQAAARRGLFRFVGRNAETEQLRAALEKAGQAQGQVVAVVGEPGVGKSRLSYEFTRSHRTRGWLILEASSVSYGKAIAYLPVIDVLKAYFKIDDRDDHREIREKVTGKLITLDEALKPLLPALLALIDITIEDAQWQSLDPAQRRQRTLDAVKRLLLRESQIQPLLLVIEDLHWVDSETQAVLDSLIESVRSARVLVLVNYRPEYRHDWGSKTYYTRLRIDPLPPEGVEELLHGLLGADESLRPLRPLLVERTEGNPFFIEESVRMLVESRVLIGKPGEYRLAMDVATIQIAPTVVAVLAARIDRLPPDEKRLLQSAAVIGRDVPFVLLQTVADVGEEALRSGLAHLQSAEFLHETRLFPDLEYSFRHALTHDVAYSGVLQERRRALHLGILEALECRPTERLTEEVERLARHALGAESWGKAATYLRNAGGRAVARSAYQAAAEWFEAALQALKRLPESPEVFARIIDVQLDLRVALIPLGQNEKVLDLMREAESMATRLGDRVRLGLVLADICARLRNVGEHHHAIEVGRRALAIAGELGDRTLELEARYRTGQAYFAVGDYRQAIDVFSRSAEDARGFADGRLPSPLVASWSRVWLALALANQGRFAEAISHAEEALRLAEKADHPFTVAEALTAVGGVYLVQGDLDRAIRAEERGLVVIREWKLQPWATLSQLGYAYALSDRLPEARRLLEEVVRGATTMNSMGVGRALQLAWLGEVNLLDGQLEDALECAQQAVSMAQGHQERGHEAWGLRLLGEIAATNAAADDRRPAERYGAALALARDLGMRPLVAHCHFGLGKLSRQAGKREESREHLTAATAMYREMEMRFWLGKAEAEMRGLA
jgi:class 3 adenylate cyclase/tetratricopeptide (TPR) repeat protein